MGRVTTATKSRPNPSPPAEVSRRMNPRRLRIGWRPREFSARFNASNYLMAASGFLADNLPPT
jgi:hypothetical protein